MTLEEYLGTLYSSDVLARGSFNDLLATFQTALEDPTLRAEAEAELADLTKIKKSRPGDYITTKKVDYLQKAL